MTQPSFEPGGFRAPERVTVSRAALLSILEALRYPERGDLVERVRGDVEWLLQRAEEAAWPL